jgi:hypothetical protein
MLSDVNLLAAESGKGDIGDLVRSGHFDVNVCVLGLFWVVLWMRWNGLGVFLEMFGYLASYIRRVHASRFSCHVGKTNVPRMQSE